MDESFTLPVTHKGMELEFPCRIVPYGYTYRLEILVNDVAVLFEPDEERSYRALVSPEQLAGARLDLSLLKEIAKVLESIR